MEHLSIPHYRYERSYGIDQNKKIELIEYQTVRETKCGYWLKIDRYTEKFVLKVSEKRYAYPSKQEAFDSFRIRTVKSYYYATRDVSSALEFIDIINSHEYNKKKVTLESFDFKQN